MFKKRLFEFLPLILIIILAFFVRIIFLDIIPNAIGGDELVYVLTAKSIFVTGRDLSQTWNPWTIFLFNYPPGQNQAELLYFLYVPIVGLLNFSLFSTRILNLVLGVGLVLIIYEIAKELFDKKTALIAGLVAAFNPWFIYIGRTAYESIPAAFFYCLGFYVLLKTKERKILFSIPVFFLAFYSYIGTKIIFIPFVVLSLLYSYLYVNKRKYRSYYLTVLIFCLILVSFFIFRIAVNHSDSRVSEIFTPNAAEVAKEVRNQRQLFINTPLTALFENKYTEFFRISIVKLFKIFSFDYLFISGDNFFSILRNGLFYILDLFFIILGISAMYAKKKRTLLFLSIFILLSTVPHILHTASENNFTFHLSLLFPFLILITAYGINEFLSFFKGKAYRIISVFLAAFYLFLIFNFLNIYFFQHTLLGYFDFRLRVLSKYILLSDNRRVFIYSNTGGEYFRKYIFYTNAINLKNRDKIASDMKTGKYSLDNATFISCDSSLDSSLHKDRVIIFDANCNYIGREKPSLKVARLSDGGADFVIFNDSLCSKYNLKPYPHITTVDSFNVEKMDDKNFCETFITRQ